MWVSEKKRSHAESHDNVEIHCLKCLAEAAYKQGYEVEMQDIASLN